MRSSPPFQMAYSCNWLCRAIIVTIDFGRCNSARRSAYFIEDIVQAGTRELITAARQGTAAECAKRAVKGLPAQSLTRLPVAAAKQRAEATKTPCADPLDDTASALCEEILLRVMALIDNEIPSIATALFSLKADDNNVPRLTDLSAEGALEFSSREPAINLYGPGGEFLPHMDHQSLTVLIPLTSPAPIEKSTCPPLAPPPPLQQQIDGESALDSGAPFSGGGTGFWSQDARVTSRRGSDARDAATCGQCYALWWESDTRWSTSR